MNYRISLLAVAAGISLNVVSVNAAPVQVVSVIKPVVYDDGNGGCIKQPGTFGKPSSDKKMFRIMGGLEQGAGLITQAVADGDHGAVSKNLESFFSGASSRGGQAQAVTAAGGAWSSTRGSGLGYVDGNALKRLRKLLPVPEPRTGSENDKAAIVPVGAVDTAVGAIGGYIIEKGIEKADKALNDYVNRDQTNESIEKYGGCRMKGTC